jgi:hypothetical protein
MNAASGAVDIVSCRVADLVSSWELAGVDASTAMGGLIASLRSRGYLTDDSREEELRVVRRQSSPAAQDRVFPATTSSTRSSPPQIQGFDQTKEASSPPGRPRVCDHWRTMDTAVRIGQSIRYFQFGRKGVCVDAELDEGWRPACSRCRSAPWSVFPEEPSPLACCARYSSPSSSCALASHSGISICCGHFSRHSSHSTHRSALSSSLSQA